MTYQEWEAEQKISPSSPEAYYAELAWNAALRTVNLEQFRPAVKVYQDQLRADWKYSFGQGHPQATDGDRLMALIDSQPKEQT